MNTKLAYCWLLVLSSFLYGNWISAQSTYQLGVLPAINLNKKFKKEWSVNLRTEARQRIVQGDFGGNDDPGFVYVLNDFSLIGARKLGFNTRLAGGYLIRFRDGAPIHRTIQQFTILQNLRSIRLAHRLSTDQTFSSQESPEFRLRYRLTTEFPLNGRSVDPKEFYIKINHEYLNSLQNSAYDLELRLVPLLGYDISNNNKVEAGLDYRVNSFLQGEARHNFWLSLNWFIEL